MSSAAVAPHVLPEHAGESPPRGASAVQTVLRGAWTVLQFEFIRSKTWKRMLLWGGVSLFPAFIIFLMLFSGDELPRGAWVSAVFVMACEMVVILNALLWVAPIVQMELEAKTWLYVVIRPYGRLCLVIGKMANGLLWTLGAGILALALVGVVSSFFAGPLIQSASTKAPATTAEQPQSLEELLRDPRVQEQIERSIRERGPVETFREFQNNPESFRIEEDGPGDFPAPFESVRDALQVGGTLAGLAILAGLAYASLFCGIGCIVPKRAMLIAFSYTLIFEAVVAFVPAIINRLTIQYHLRCLLNRWVDLDVPEEGKQLFFSDWPAWWHVAVLATMVVAWQTISLVVVHLRQYVMTDET
jgi:hypothetical protein